MRAIPVSSGSTWYVPSPLSVDIRRNMARYSPALNRRFTSSQSAPGSSSRIVSGVTKWDMGSCIRRPEPRREKVLGQRVAFDRPGPFAALMRGHEHQGAAAEFQVDAVDVDDGRAHVPLLRVIAADPVAMHDGRVVIGPPHDRGDTGNR